MSMTVGGIQTPGVVATSIQQNKQIAEEALNRQIQEVAQEPERSIKALQTPSPYSQFLDVKV